MKKNWQKLACLLLCLVLTMGLAACGSASTSGGASAAGTSSGSSPQQGETYIFTDSAGREVELPRNIERVACGGPLANIVVYAIKPEVIVGWSSAPSKSAQKYIGEAYWDLPEYGKFYGNTEDFNREALMASNPQVIIDIGEWDEEYKAQLDTLQEQLGIPVILIECNMDQTAAAYRTAGQLLNNEERGEELAAYCEKVLSETKDRAASIPEEDRKTVYYGEGETGLSTILSGTIHSQVYELVGAKIVVDADSAQVQRGGGTVSMEQLMAWNPDVIMFAQDSIYSTAASDPTWNALTAIKDGQYYEIPAEPYDWLGRPPGPNRMIGILWLGNLLYPEVFDYDIAQETKDFFRLFYRYELSDEEVAGLLANSTLKTPQ